MKFFATQSCPFIYRLSWTAFTHSWVVAAETTWSTKLKIFTLWPFKKKFATPRFKGLDSFVIQEWMEAKQSKTKQNKSLYRNSVDQSKTRGIGSATNLNVLPMFTVIGAKKEKLEELSWRYQPLLQQAELGVQKGVSEESHTNFSVLQVLWVFPSFLNLFLCSSHLSVSKHRDIKVCFRVIWGFLRYRDGLLWAGPGLWPWPWSPVSEKRRATAFAWTPLSYFAGVFVVVLSFVFFFISLHPGKTLACALWISCSLWFEPACLGSCHG